MGGVQILPLQIGEIFPEAYLLTIDVIGIHPDLVLGEFRIIELCPLSIRITIDSLGTESK